jgi:hypothetical protein
VLEATLLRRERERGDAFHVLVVDFVRVVEQGVHRGVVAALDGEQQRRVAVADGGGGGVRG